VLKRRKEIETHLTSLTIVRATDSTAGTPNYTAPPPVVSKQVTTTTGNSVTAKTVVPPPLVVKPIGDTSSKIALPPIGPFVIDTTAAQMVVIVLDKVDVVYLNECLNAFNRYNTQNIRTQKFELQKFKLNPNYSLVTISSVDFINAAKAQEYILKVKPKAASAIVPWLEASKFSFMIISQSNLDLLKLNFDVPAYRKKLQDILPGKF